MDQKKITAGLTIIISPKAKNCRTLTAGASSSNKKRSQCPWLTPTRRMVRRITQGGFMLRKLGCLFRTMAIPSISSITGLTITITNSSHAIAPLRPI